MMSLKPRMTLQVIRLDATGRVRYDSGVRAFYDGEEEGTATSLATTVDRGFPPCQCPHCRRSR